jgi:histidine triad (HIT) family protein
MPENCLFCKVVSGEVPATIVWQDDDAVAFDDINPHAPTHVLVVPRKHLADIGELASDPEVAVAMLRAIRAVAAERGLTDYRTVFNTGAQVGQSVFHVHAHVLAGRPFRWPPG